MRRLSARHSPLASRLRCRRRRCQVSALVATCAVSHTKRRPGKREPGRTPGGEQLSSAFEGGILQCLVNLHVFVAC